MKHTTLTNLTLSYNGLTTLPTSFGNLTSLTHLDLRGNQLTMLPESFRNLTNLTALGLEENPISTDEQVHLRSLLPNCDIVF